MYVQDPTRVRGPKTVCMQTSAAPANTSGMGAYYFRARRMPANTRRSATLGAYAHHGSARWRGLRGLGAATPAKIVTGWNNVQIGLDASGVVLGPLDSAGNVQAITAGSVVWPAAGNGVADPPTAPSGYEWSSGAGGLRVLSGKPSSTGGTGTQTTTASSLPWWVWVGGGILAFKLLSK